MYNTHLYCPVVQAGFYRVLALDVRCPWFDPPPGQMEFSIFSPLTFGAKRKITQPMASSTSVSKTDSWNAKLRFWDKSKMEGECVLPCGTSWHL